MASASSSPRTTSKPRAEDAAEDQFAHDIHLLTLFQRIGATKNPTSGQLTLPVDTLRSVHRSLGLSRSDMDACLRPIVLAGRRVATFQDFVQVLNDADPFVRASAAAADEGTPSQGFASVRSHQPVSNIYAHAPHAPPSRTHPATARNPRSNLSSATTHRSRRGHSATASEPNSARLLQPPGSKGFSEGYADGVRLYSSELQRLCDISDFDGGRSLTSSKRAEALDSVPVSQLAGLAIDQMSVDEKHRGDSPHRAPRFVEMDDIARAASGGSPLRGEDLPPPQRFQTAADSPQRPRVPRVPRCASKAPPRYTSDRARRLQAERQQQREHQEAERARREVDEPGTRGSSRAAGRPGSSTYPGSRSRSPAQLRSTSRQGGSHAPRPPSGSRHGLRRDQRHTHSRASDAEEEAVLPMMVEDERLLAHEEGGEEVTDATARKSGAFRRQRQLDATIFVQAQMRFLASEYLANVAAPNACTLQRVMRGFHVRRRLGGRRHDIAIRPLMRLLHHNEQRPRHAVLRMAPLPKMPPKEDGSSAARESEPSPPQQQRHPSPPSSRSGVMRSQSSVVTPQSSIVGAQRLPPKQSNQPGKGKAAKGAKAKSAPSEGEASPAQKKLGSAADTALLRASEQAIVKDRCARAIQHFSRLVRARGLLRELKATAEDGHDARIHAETIPVIQAYARHATTRLTLMSSLRGQLRRRAVRAIQHWWRERRFALVVRRMSRIVARENEHRINFENNFDVVLRCGLWWRGAAARRRYKFKCLAVTRNIDNRVNVERQRDAQRVLARVVRWFISNRRTHRKWANMAKANETRIRDERERYAARDIQRGARRLLGRCNRADREAQLSARDTAREAAERADYQASIIQMFVATAIANREAIVPAAKRRMIRNVTTIQSLHRRSVVKPLAAERQTALAHYLAGEENRAELLLYQAFARALVSRNRACLRVARPLVKTAVESGVRKHATNPGSDPSTPLDQSFSASMTTPRNSSVRGRGGAADNATKRFANSRSTSRR